VTMYNGTVRRREILSKTSAILDIKLKNMGKRKWEGISKKIG
jgi:hypothetical protein